MIVRDAGMPAYVSVPNSGTGPAPLTDLIDAEVEITGVGLPHYGAERMFVGPHIETWSKNCIKVIKPTPADPFTSPRLGDIFHVGPTELAKMRRHLVEGNVLAVWSRNKLLLREDGGRLILGIADGHFGLTGIHDRVERLDGTFNIDSHESGTEAYVTLNMKQALEATPCNNP